MREPRPPASGASRGVCGCRRPAHLTPRRWQQVRRLRDPSSSRAPPSQGPALLSDLRRRLTTPPHLLPALAPFSTHVEPSEGGACHQGLEGSSKHIGTWRKNSEPAREHCGCRGPAGRAGVYLRMIRQTRDRGRLFSVDSHPGVPLRCRHNIDFIIYPTLGSVGYKCVQNFH